MRKDLIVVFKIAFKSWLEAMAFRRLVRRLRVCPTLINGPFLVADSYVLVWISFVLDCLTGTNVN